MRCHAILVLCISWLTVSSVLAQDVIITADANNGRDACWIKRYSMGVNSWGIRGTGKPLNGFMWWNSFPGATAKYKVYLGAVTEGDGNSQYRFYIAGTQVHSGRYPYSTGSLNCSMNAPNKVQELYMGEHSVAKGVQIKFWGESVYPCGSAHGQYTRFYRIKFVRTGAATGPTEPTVPATKITSGPATGSVLEEKKSYTFGGEGKNLKWSWDAASDGIGPTQFGTGTSASFTVPTGVKDPRTLVVTLTGDGGAVTRNYSIGAGAVGVKNFTSHTLTPSRGMVAVYSLRGEHIGMYPFSGARITSSHKPLPAGTYLIKTGGRFMHYSVVLDQ